MSIELTIANPLFGVGMGDFPSAAAELQKNRGEHQLWQVTHNSYTQISCETGVVGFLIMMIAFAASLVGLWKIDRAARRLGLMDIANLALCMTLSFVVLMIHFSFDALAYDFYFPLLAGVSTALIFTARSVIAEIEAKLRNPVKVEPPPATITATWEPAPQPQPDTVTVGHSSPRRNRTGEPLQGGNPYRMGRRR